MKVCILIYLNILLSHIQYNIFTLLCPAKSFCPDIFSALICLCIKREMSVTCYSVQLSEVTPRPIAQMCASS